MANVAKNANDGKISVYPFHGSIVLPTKLIVRASCGARTRSRLAAT